MISRMNDFYGSSHLHGIFVIIDINTREFIKFSSRIHIWLYSTFVIRPYDSQSDGRQQKKKEMELRFSSNGPFYK